MKNPEPFSNYHLNKPQFNLLRSLRWVTPGMVLFTLLFASCQNQEQQTATDVQNQSNPSCTLCPKIKSGQDTLEFTNEVRRFVADNTDKGWVFNDVCDNFLENMEKFGVDTFLKLFALDAGRATCGLNARIMVEILLENGIDAYTYNFGFEGKSDLSHVVVLVKHRGRLLIFDPHFNYALLNPDGSNMDIISLINAIGARNLQFKTTTDTAIADLLIDEKILNATPAMRDSVMADANCAALLTSGTVSGNMRKIPLQRCFSCESNRKCFGFAFIKKFEQRLRKETDFNSYHEGLVIRLGTVSGADDWQDMEDRIQTAIYSQPDMGKRIRGKLR